MTHEDAGHYAAKHPKGKKDPRIASAIEEKVSDGKITCAVAHKIANRMNIPPDMVGMNVDLMEKRISKCQLGLYGYGAAKEKAFKPADVVNEELKTLIDSRLENNKLTCAAAWDIADQLNLKRMDISSACDALKIKIIKCQLGAF